VRPFKFLHSPSSSGRHNLTTAGGLSNTGHSGQVSPQSSAQSLDGTGSELTNHQPGRLSDVVCEDKNEMRLVIFKMKKTQIFKLILFQKK